MSGLLGRLRLGCSQQLLLLRLRRPPASVRPLSFRPVAARCVLLPRLPGPRLSSHDSSRKEPSSLADEVLRVREQEEKQKQGQSEEGAKEGDKKEGGYKPLTTWQKRGYIIFGTFMIGGLLVNAAIYGERINLGM